MWPSVSGSKYIGPCSCRSGMSASPSGIRSRRRAGARAGRPWTRGLEPRPSRRRDAGGGCRLDEVRTSRFWSFGPRSPRARRLVPSHPPPTPRWRRTGARRHFVCATPARRSSSLPRSPTGRARAVLGRSSRCRGRGCDGSNMPATGSPTTSFESATSAMRSATRRFVFARRLSLMTPAGRCVAMIRWMPSERPRCAMSTTPSTNSGTSPASAANSSMTSTSAGGVSGSCRFSSSSRSFAFLRLNRCSRWCSSARRLVRARRTRCGLRSVTRPTQCGSSTQSANADPPL